MASRDSKDATGKRSLVAIAILSAASHARQQGDVETEADLLAILETVAQRALVSPGETIRTGAIANP